MRRTHWLLLATGVLLMVLTTTDWLDAPPPESLPDSLAGEPDLYMEDAEIRQFGVDGLLQYRLDAERIAHFPTREGAPARTELTTPRLRLERTDGPPWQVAAGRGTVLAPPDDPEAEVVELEEDVRLLRRFPDQRFLTVTSSAMTLWPVREYARTDQPVMIRSHSGTTTASAMEGDLAGGVLRLFASPGTDPARPRVHTVIPPEPLEPDASSADLFPPAG